MMGHEDAYAHMHTRDWMAKVDVKSAFRTVGIHPKHWGLIAYQWRHRDGRTRYYIETRFPFGLTTAPETFCRLTQAVQAMLTTRGIHATIVYVDDFLILAASQTACEQAKQFLIELLTQLGFTVSPTKVFGPAQQ